MGAPPSEDGFGLAVEESLEFADEELPEVEVDVDPSPAPSESVEKQLSVAVEVGVAVDEVEVDVAVEVDVDDVEVAVDVDVEVDVAVEVDVEVAVEVDDDGKQLWSAACRALKFDGRKVGMLKPDGSEKGNGYEYGYPPYAEGVAVGVLGGAVAPAGHVLASSRYWICCCPASVITVADACVS